MIDGLRAWLDLGVELGMLRERADGYALGSRSARSLAEAANDPIVAFYEELNDLHHPLITQTPDRLRSGDKFPLGAESAQVVARTSGLSEPFLRPAIDGVIPPDGPVRLLEVGCGSAAHIRTPARSIRS